MFNLPKFELKSSIISTLFGVDPLGLHLKVFRRDSNASGGSVWPDATGKFTVPADCFEAEVIGFHMEDDEEDLFQESTVLQAHPSKPVPSSSRSTPCSLPIASRRLAQLPYPYMPTTSLLQGKRTVPSLRNDRNSSNSSYLSAFRGKRSKPFTKDIMFSKPDFGTDRLENVFPVTVNLSSLSELSPVTISEAIENMLDIGEQILITNKRGDLIQDMATTRGKAETP